MKIIKTLLILLFISSLALAQEGENLSRKEQRKKRKAEQTKYFVEELGLGYSSAQDFRLSNQIYKGAGIALSLGSFKQSPRTITEFQWLVGMNYVTSQAGVTGFDGTMSWNYTYLKVIRTFEDQPWRVAIGGKADILAQGRYMPSLGNSSIHWDGLFSLGVASRFEQDFEIPFIKKQVLFYGKVHLPFVSYVNRPIYAVSGWDFPEQSVATFGRFFRLETEGGLIFRVSKNNQNLFRIGYKWDIYRFRDNDIHRVITGHHYLNFGLMVKM